MVKVTGPCYSISASGTIADAITYSAWKGIAYAREWFTPANPQSASQVNVRTALALMVVCWQNQHVSVKAFWNTYAEGTGMSGFNQFMRRGMDQYISQLGVSTTPASVSVTAVAPPDEVWTWSA